MALSLSLSQILNFVLLFVWLERKVGATGTVRWSRPGGEVGRRRGGHGDRVAPGLARCSSRRGGVRRPGRGPGRVHRRGHRHLRRARPAHQPGRPEERRRAPEASGGQGEAMKIVLQRVKEARVDVDGATSGRIGRGVCLLVGVEKGDREADAEYLARKCVELRIFPDSAGQDEPLARRDGRARSWPSPSSRWPASVRKGRRPSFDGAEEPGQGGRAVRSFRRRRRGARRDRGDRGLPGHDGGPHRQRRPGDLHRRIQARSPAPGKRGEAGRVFSPLGGRMGVRKSPPDSPSPAMPAGPLRARS